jgi:hypothetical protein
MMLYNVICDVCGFKYKNTEVRKRWDGLIVCEADYETRNILDFYKPKNDVHTLPFTRPETGDDGAFDIDAVGITGEYESFGSYIVDEDDVVHYKITINPTEDSVVGSTVTILVPSGNVGTDHGGTASLSDGTFLGAVSATGEDITVPDFTINASPRVSLMVAGSYTKA